MHAELQKEEEEGQQQCAHQNVLKEPRAGTCQTRAEFSQVLLGGRPLYQAGLYLLLQRSQVSLQ